MKVLVVLLAATLLAIALGPEDESVEVIMPVARAAVAGMPAGVGSHVVDYHVSELQARVRAPGTASLFPVPPQAPAPVVQPPVQPPVPTPPLPFTVIGEYEESGRRLVFLEHQGGGVVVSAGDFLADNRYRVDDITDDHIKLTYLASNQSQTLLLGGRRNVPVE